MQAYIIFFMFRASFGPKLGSATVPNSAMLSLALALALALACLADGHVHG